MCLGSIIPLFDFIASSPDNYSNSATKYWITAVMKMGAVDPKVFVILACSIIFFIFLTGNMSRVFTDTLTFFLSLANSFLFFAYFGIFYY